MKISYNFILIFLALIIGLFIGNSLDFKFIDNRPYLADVPPSPKYEEMEFHFRDQVEEGCSKDSIEIGYILKVTKFEFPEYEVVFQNEEGKRDLISINPNYLSNVELQNLKSILSPGVKLKIQTESCGSGGYLDLLYLKTLKRTVF